MKRHWALIFATEGLQNTPFVFALVMGAWLSRTGLETGSQLHVIGGGLVLLSGAALAAWLIRETEGWKRGKWEFRREPARLTVTNALLFVGGGLLFGGLFILFSPTWFAVVTEAALGSAVGVGIALTQGRAGGSEAFSSPKSVLQHAIAFVLATPLTMLMMHFGVWQSLPGALAMAAVADAVMTGVIAVGDYQSEAGTEDDQTR